MIIELRGVEFVNKGAELMLQAILQKMRQTTPDVIFVMEKTARTPIAKLKENNILMKVHYIKYRVNWAFLGHMIPKSLLRNKGYILSRDIDVVFDGSGFAFGDQWGAAKAGMRLANKIIEWKAQGKKIIMLPQAFGPFTDSELINKMKIITENADIIFARDKISYDYLTKLASNDRNIILKPDFTNLIKGIVPSYFDASKYGVAIIPNSKMIETATKEGSTAYLNLMEKIIIMLKENGKKPFFLIHEGKTDIHIADQINNKLSEKIPVLQEDDPLVVKGIIGSSSAVVTSRFHGLVSCLSQSIPCLATGWSHKYEMLLEDYNYPEALLDVNCGEATLLEKVDLIIADASRESIKQKLKDASVKQKNLSEETWSIILNKIKSN